MIRKRKGTLLAGSTGEEKNDRPQNRDPGKMGKGMNLGLGGGKIFSLQKD